MIRWGLFAVVAALPALSACGHALEYTSLNPPPRPLAPRAPDSVEIYMAKQPERPFVEVGLFHIEQRSPSSGGTDEMLSKLRERAGAVGCDALVLGEGTQRVQSVTGHLESIDLV